MIDYSGYPYVVWCSQSQTYAIQAFVPMNWEKGLYSHGKHLFPNSVWKERYII